MNSFETFLKRCSDPQRLISEKEGLEFLRAHMPRHSPLRVVKVLSLTQEGLNLELIKTFPPNQQHWKMFGEGLALLHLQVGESFGLESDNFIGHSPQPNSIMKSWSEFTLEQRLFYQIHKISDQALRDEFLTLLEAKRNVVVDLLEAHRPHPAPLHGDLWSGNILFDQQGPVLIDPAVYWGDPEADLAMLELFGRPAPAFYQAYESLRPRPKKDQSARLALYQLYHLLNHFNLFGKSYLPSCLKIISRL